MASTFHPFPRLPLELRVIIWKLAIRPDVPGAHVFRVYNAGDPEKFDLNPDDEARCNIPSAVSTARLAAPKCLRRGLECSMLAQQAAPISWTRNNPSSYLVDSALWTTCTESLQVMRSEFQNRLRRSRQECWGETQIESLTKAKGCLTLPEMATFSTQDGPTRCYLTFFPNQDLFILQTHDIASLDWSLVRDSIPSYTFEASLGWTQLSAWHPEGERHIALEYYPAWDQYMIGNEIQSCILESTAQPDLEPFHFWFIDYQLKRCSDERAITEVEPAEQQGPREFYARDRRFVEVRDGELVSFPGLEDDSSRPWKRCGTSKAYRTSGRFVWQLNRDRYPMVQRRSGEEVRSIEFGLLACEDL